MTLDVLDVALALARVLESIGVDFVVLMLPRHAQALADALGPDYSVDVAALEEAVRTSWSWSLLHLASGVKIDLMMRQATPYDLTAFARRRPSPCRPAAARPLRPRRRD